jgi:uncharacterized lipoprotein YddW (UPF0748 family)
MAIAGPLFRAARALGLVAVASLFAYASPATVAPAPQPPDEVRGLWVLRSSLSSPQSIAALVRSARASGFNTLFVQVRGRGEAYYASRIEPRATELAGQPLTFDPLAEVIEAARASGLRVHAWVNVNLVSSAAKLPADRTHVIYRHPDWLMVPRAIGQELRLVDGHSPAYAGKISRWTRAQSDTVEGLYLSPIVPEAAAYTEAVVAEIAARYAVDGVHLDYIRYPTAEFDYSRFAIAEFRDEIASTLAAPRRAALDRRAEVDPYAYPDAFQPEWTQFRRARLSALAMRLRTAVKRTRPSALVTAAVRPDIADAYTNRLQDWRTWLESGILDAACPMAYTTDADLFAQQIASAGAVAGPRGIWAGIGAWRLTPAQTVQHIGLARRAGVGGFVLFSYDSLTGLAQARHDYLGEVGRAAFPAAPAPAPAGTR